MITKRKSFVAIVFAALALTGVSANDALAQGNGCLSRSEAVTAVRTGQVASLSQLLGQYPRLANADVVSAELCQSGGRYYYLVSVLLGGTVKTVTVEASTVR